MTPSKQPTFSHEWVKAGAHINGVGAYTPDMCEIPRESIKQANVVVFDTMDGVLQEAGDFISPLKDGYVDRAHYTGELGQLVLGTIEGRQNETDITVFKTVGLDVFVASEIVKKAKERGLGTTI